MFLLRDSINEQDAWSLRVISISIAKTEALAQVVMSNMVRLYNAQRIDSRVKTDSDEKSTNHTGCSKPFHCSSINLGNRYCRGNE